MNKIPETLEVLAAMFLGVVVGGLVLLVIAAYMYVIFWLLCEVAG